MDPSGVRLRAWMGIAEDVFYDASRVAVVPMGFCFPGYNQHGGDLPPRRECAPAWRDRVRQLCGLLYVRIHIDIATIIKPLLGNQQGGSKSHHTKNPY